MRCRLLNISADGAAVEVPDPAFVPSHFQLMTEKDRVIRRCRVIWIKQNRIGVAFDQANAEDNSYRAGQQALIYHSSRGPAAVPNSAVFALRYVHGLVRMWAVSC